MSSNIWAIFVLGFVVALYGIFLLYRLTKGYGYSWTTNKFVEPNKASKIEKATMLLSTLGVFLSALLLLFYSFNNL